MPRAMVKQRIVSEGVWIRSQCNGWSGFVVGLVFALALRCQPAMAAAVIEAGAGKPTSVVTGIYVNRVNIFDPAQAQQSRVYRLVNTLHSTTKEQTILRELGVAPGDRVGPAEVAEFERILRRMDLFSSVSVDLRPAAEHTDDGISVSDPDAVHLHIQTRDRVSIVAGASGSFLGGVGELGFTLGDRNVAGLGDSFLLSYSGNTDDELRGSIAYRDIHFINNQQRADYQFSRTEEGDSYRLKFQRPFKNRLDKKAWSVLVESVERDIDYYENGFSVVQVPEHKQLLEFSGSWRHGSDKRSIRRGLTLRAMDLQYQASLGVQADTITAPLDSTRLYAGVVLARDLISEYRKTSGLDTLRFIQDLTLGSTIELQAGITYKEYEDEAGNNTSVNPLLSLGYSNAFAAGENTLLRFSLNGRATLASLSAGDDADSSDGQPWSVGASARWFNTAFDKHTLAARIDYTIADNSSGLPVQYTLGENNGLRGYASRLLSGNERIRLNLEDRMDFGWRAGVFDIGLLWFVDIGWVADDDASSLLKRSAGVGLRLGSDVLFGASVVRMDLAVPFDDDSGRHEPTLSISLGQVFNF